MGCYSRLTLEERYQISALKDSGFSVRGIARSLNRSPSSISREFNRSPSKKYDAKRSQKSALLRRQKIAPPRKIFADLQLEIVSLLELQWSPEQISNYLRKSKGIFISHETIYKFVYRDRLRGGELYRHLRWARKLRRRREVTRNLRRSGLRSGRTSIAEREKIVEERSRIGDYERDTMLVKNGRLLTIVDRTSRLLKIAKLKRLNAFAVHQETIRLLENERVQTMTNDNGVEFSCSDLTEMELKIKVYYAEPYCSWQRGTNENTNGLIRQYVPRATDMNTVTQEDLDKIATLLNNRPRKCLGYSTPNEVHKRLSQGVALRI